MQYKLHSFIAGASLLLAGINAQAQTISTFEDVALSGANISFLETMASQQGDGLYSFESGNARFWGTVAFGGSYQSLFNCSNHTDVTTQDWTNQWSNMLGIGYNNSDNYGIAYAEVDMNNYSQSVELGVKLLNDAIGHPVEGFYVTNTTYSYGYMQSEFIDGDAMKLIVRGYLNNVLSQNNVTVTLGEVTANGANIINSWEWVDLMSLGNVDSITFQIVSTDEFAPYYFAIDDLITNDGYCTPISNLSVADLGATQVTISWDRGVNNLDYEIAIDQSATLEPIGSSSIITDTFYYANNLNAATNYYVHIRSVCPGNTFSEWDTLSFSTTTGNSINTINTLQAQINPNPVESTLFITSIDSKVNAVVYSIDGKELVNKQNIDKIDVSNLASGMYFVQLTDAKTGQIGIYQFVKQ